MGSLLGKLVKVEPVVTVPESIVKAMASMSSAALLTMMTAKCQVPVTAALRLIGSLYTYIYIYVTVFGSAPSWCSDSGSPGSLKGVFASPKCYFLQHSGACMSQNAITYSILEHACPKVPLFTKRSPILELIHGIPGLSGFPGFSGNGVRSRRTDPPKPRAGVLG